MKEVKTVRLVAIFAMACMFGSLFCPLGEVNAQTKKPEWSYGWEMDKSLVRIGDIDRWAHFGYYAYPHMAYDLTGDGKWVLISNRACNAYYSGYYYNKTTGKWVEDKTLISGLKSRGWREYPAFAYNVTGDKKWTMICHQGSSFYGYYWNGKKWVEDPSRVRGLSSRLGHSGTYAAHTFLRDLKGKGKWTLLLGTIEAFYWNGKEWVEDTSRLNGLPKLYRSTSGFNVFGKKKWNLIVNNVNSKSFRVFRWDGTKWNEDKAKAAGLKTDLPHLIPTLGHNLTGDGKWVLISAVEQAHTLIGFQYKRVDVSSLPLQKGVASNKPLATTARIRFTYPRTWNHRIKYSTKSDMSNAAWSKWFEDMDKVDVKLGGLTPKTTYYYQVYTYVPWDTSYSVASPRKTFATIAARKHIVVKAGKSIQDALEMLPLAGGTIELAKGVHDVRDTIVINRSNITIQGTHESVIRANEPLNDVFAIPHANQSLSEPWKTMPILENFTFKGFKVTTSYKKRRGRALVRAWNVKNLTAENILDESRLGALVGINPSGWSTSARAENIFIKNNNTLRSSIVFCFAKNVHVTGNTLKSGTIDINNSNLYVYIKNNKVSGGSNYNIRAHSGNHIWIEDNLLLGGTQIGIMMDGTSHLIIRNNVITNCSSAGINFDCQWGTKCSVRNNRIYNNSGHGISTSSHGGRSFKKPCDIDIVNNTICTNGRNGINMGVEWIGFKDFSNNIIAGNKGYGINYVKTLKPPTIIKYNNFWNNAKGNYNKTSTGTGDISADPLFVGPAKGNFYLKSKSGRWDPKAEKWVKDTVSSPCIDAGDPKAELSKEPMPNGRKVNIGAYGNTTEASKSMVR
ncbi:MAG: right-handed parallel beta-helix repeat-containing protein [Phycisphaerae bacterium]|nr:right-handed parallel beta-helix repeat-containing protein [Phycisphaerae bacterium]